MPPEKEAIDFLELNYIVPDFTNDNTQDIPEVPSKEVRVAEAIIEQQLSKFKDVLINDYTIKQERKKQKQRMKEIQAAL